MSLPPLVDYVAPTWSFTFDARPAPRYVRFAVHGQPTHARMQQMLAVLHAREPQLRLANGKLCPIVVDRRVDSVPDPAILQLWRTTLEARQQQLSGVITLIDPTRADRVLMEISLEILGQFLAPHFATVTSWEAALVEVERCPL